MSEDNMSCEKEQHDIQMSNMQSIVLVEHELDVAINKQMKDIFLKQKTIKEANKLSITQSDIHPQ